MRFAHNDSASEEDIGERGVDLDNTKEADEEDLRKPATAEEMVEEEDGESDDGDQSDNKERENEDEDEQDAYTFSPDATDQNDTPVCILILI